MRKLIIILAVFALLFFAVLIWGVARDRDPPAPGEEANCNDLPRKGNGDIDTGGMKRWKQRCAPKKAEGSANLFAQGVKLSPVSMSFGADNTQFWQVPPADDEDTAQQVILTLVSGGLVRLKAPKPSDDADEEQELCLCQGRHRIADLKDACTRDWVAENVTERQGQGKDETGQCPADAIRTKLFFGPDGGQFEVEPLGQSAELSSRK